MNPGEVTRILVRVAPQDAAARAKAKGKTVRPGVNLYPFEPWAAKGTRDSFGYPGGPGYVWHCHIIDHEDNEMMRPMSVTWGSPLYTALATTPAATLGEGALPERVELLQNYPNPASGGTRFDFSLPAQAEVDLCVFDLAGREVRALASGTFAAGRHSVDWDGVDAGGSPVRSGTYFYRLRAAGTTRIGKLLFVR
jgi:hypothetical protein